MSVSGRRRAGAAVVFFGLRFLRGVDIGRNCLGWSVAAGRVTRVHFKVGITPQRGAHSPSRVKKNGRCSSNYAGED